MVDYTGSAEQILIEISLHRHARIQLRMAEAGDYIEAARDKVIRGQKLTPRDLANISRANQALGKH